MRTLAALVWSQPGSSRVRQLQSSLWGRVFDSKLSVTYYYIYIQRRQCPFPSLVYLPILVNLRHHAHPFRQGILIKRGRSNGITAHKTLTPHATSALTRMRMMGCVLGFLNLGGQEWCPRLRSTTPSPSPSPQPRLNV